MFVNVADDVARAQNVVVPALVTESVVNHFEMIQVNHNDCKIRHPLSDFFVEILNEIIVSGFVFDMSERILIGEVVEFRHVLLQVRDLVFGSENVRRVSLDVARHLSDRV